MKNRNKNISVLWLALFFCVPFSLYAQQGCNLAGYEPDSYDFVMKQDRYGKNDVETDYFKLAISWSPAFCEKSRQRLFELKKQGKSKQVSQLQDKLRLQCLSGQSFGWVIHGLWGQAEKARRVSDHPRFCQGDLPQVAFDKLKPYLCSSPGAHLLQGEWEKHGSCDFPTPSAYFERQQKLFAAIQLPAGYRSTSHAIRWVKNRNPHLTDKWLEKGRGEFYVCYDKSFQPMDCPR